MNKQTNAVTAVSYTAGILAIVSAVIVFILCIMSALGLFEPKKTRITVSSANKSVVYNGQEQYAGDPYVSIGKLNKGHSLSVLSYESYTEVGVYPNESTFIIVDESGSDVTDFYDIAYDFGDLKITGIPLIIASDNRTVGYSGTPLVCDELYIYSGKLLPGHSFVSLAKTSITEPGTKEIEPLYAITDSNGNDVTGMYDADLHMGTLTVNPITINLQTGSASKKYDGLPLKNDSWEHISGRLLDGHVLKVDCYGEAVEPGSYDNLASVGIEDPMGKDVTNLYNVKINYGKLDISAITLHISTGSATKEYDGSPLSNDEWRLVSGSLAYGESLKIVSTASAFDAGTTLNSIKFAVVDQNGADMTARYEIILSPGSLTITPRKVIIRTGSASKVYDETPLECKTYEILQGTICQGDELDFAFTSLTEIGYTDNYVVEATVYRRSDGERRDVSKNYRFTFEYGKLRVTVD